VLRTGGFDTVDKVLEATPEQLLALPGFDQDTIDAVVAAARTEQAHTEPVEPAEPAGPTEPVE
jgi:hypothetical protein